MNIPQLTDAEITRFRQGVHRGPGCHLWTRETNNKGYGRFTIYRAGGRVRILTHRLAYALANEIDPGGAKLRHTCDNPPCCNPAHLIPGTQADNIRDAVERGRMNIAGLATEWNARGMEAFELLTRGMKTCYGDCRRDLPVSAFWRCKEGFGGLASRCKACSIVDQRRYRARLREREAS